MTALTSLASTQPTEVKAAAGDALQSSLGPYLGSAIGLSAGSLRADQTSPFRVELDAVKGVAETRRIDFLNGRYRARIALELVGCAPQHIPRNPDRSPIWPLGFTGSISHSKTTCVAIAARSDHVAAMGVDIEGISPRVDSLREKILHPLERDLRPETDAAYNTAVFSAKEAFFKAYFSATQHFLGFQDAVVRFRPNTDRFDIRIINPKAPALFGLHQFEGVSLTCENEAVSVLWITAAAIGAINSDHTSPAFSDTPNQANPDAP